jgi:hypothetical protein
MIKDGKPLETLLEDAVRACPLAIVLDGDPAALEQRYAEEVGRDPPACGDGGLNGGLNRIAAQARRIEALLPRFSVGMSAACRGRRSGVQRLLMDQLQ